MIKTRWYLEMTPNDLTKLQTSPGAKAELLFNPGHSLMMSLFRSKNHLFLAETNP